LRFLSCPELLFAFRCMRLRSGRVLDSSDYTDVSAHISPVSFSALLISPTLSDILPPSFSEPVPFRMDSETDMPGNNNSQNISVSVPDGSNIDTVISDGSNNHSVITDDFNNDSSQNVSIPDDSNNNSFQNAILSLMRQQQESNSLMLKMLSRMSLNQDQKKESISYSNASISRSVSDLPKFSEIISSEDAFYYLGTRDLKRLDDSDILITRALKFLSFKSKFLRLTDSYPEEVRLDALYRCLSGSVQNRAIREPRMPCEDLLKLLSVWCASSADLGLLEDVLRENLKTLIPALMSLYLIIF